MAQLLRDCRFLKCDFAAMVAGVSIISQANFDMVLPEQGAMTMISVNFLGPMGSASGMVWIISLPVMFSISSMKSFAFPNFVSIEYALYDMTGTISAPFRMSSFILGIVF